MSSPYGLWLETMNSRPLKISLRSVSLVQAGQCLDELLVISSVYIRDVERLLMSSAFHYAGLMFVYGGCEMFAMKYDDLELLMAGGDDLDLGSRCKMTAPILRHLCNRWLWHK